MRLLALARWVFAFASLASGCGESDTPSPAAASDSIGAAPADSPATPAEAPDAPTVHSCRGTEACREYRGLPYSETMPNGRVLEFTTAMLQPACEGQGGTWSAGPCDLGGVLGSCVEDHVTLHYFNAASLETRRTFCVERQHEWVAPAR